MKNCIELDAVDKWIDLGLFRLGQSYLSLRGQDDEETSFFCLAPMRIVISMTIEIKDLIKIMQIKYSVEWYYIGENRVVRTSYLYVGYVEYFFRFDGAVF